LRKWFFFPGFTPHTGGLIREADLLERQRAFNARAWLEARGLQHDADEQVVSLFCYENAALSGALHQWAGRPTLLLATPGHAARQILGLLGPRLQRGALRAIVLPALTQREFDELLWACDFNAVRGEDSFARAQWAGKPFVWQAYPQDDGAHAVKLEAFLQRFLAGADPVLAARMGGAFQAWNAVTPALPPLEATPEWCRHSRAWRDQLLGQIDLTSQLLGFVAETR
jgi:uncharacterized repeat protein (TIGR03837 family)